MNNIILKAIKIGNHVRVTKLETSIVGIVSSVDNCFAILTCDTNYIGDLFKACTHPRRIININDFRLSLIPKDEYLLFSNLLMKSIEKEQNAKFKELYVKVNDRVKEYIKLHSKIIVKIVRIGHTDEIDETPKPITINRDTGESFDVSSLIVNKSFGKKINIRRNKLV